MKSNEIIGLCKKIAEESGMVEVVRCKDCKWSDWYEIFNGEHRCYCMETGIGGRTENDYCSYGERGEQDDSF